MKTKRPRNQEAATKGCRRRLRWIMTCAAAGILLAPGAGTAGMPQPAVVYYGQARDSFGWPYREGADVVLRAGTNEIARHSIAGSLSPGVNFALHAPIDDGRDGTPYVRYAATTGAVASIVVVDGRGERAILENAGMPPIGKPGEVVRINVTAGLDADGDGIPDEWEWELIRWANDPALGSIHDVRPGDDYDGDGVSNLDEYRAGTFAFLDYDKFSAEAFWQAANGRLGIDFLTVPGKAYWIESASIGLIEGGFRWEAAAYSPTESGDWREGPVEGTGDWMTFFVAAGESNLAWRLKVE